MSAGGDGTLAYQDQSSLLVGKKNQLPSSSAASTSSSGMSPFGELYSCNDLFGKHQLHWIHLNGSSATSTMTTASTTTVTTTCLEHGILKWIACPLGKRIQIDPSQISGSYGGEPIEQVRYRDEEQEKLQFSIGSLIVENPIPHRLVESLDGHFRRFLSSAKVGLVVETLPQVSKSSTEHHRNEIVSMNDDETMTTTLLVRRGNYANPCMTILSMYNVFVVLQAWDRLPSDDKANDEHRNRLVSHRRHPLKIIWLDGHARAHLDPMWSRLFQTKPIPIKQLTPSNNNTSSTVTLRNAIVVNTMSAIGDEGLGLYKWSGTKNDNNKQNNGPTEKVPCLVNSTLVAFRDFVLNRYNLARRQLPPLTETRKKRKLTLLVRKNHVAHPRSNGVTDRTLANVTEDVLYLQSQYPSSDYDVQIVSFEGLDFEKQLEYITDTDVFLAVHGAGNIHILFLPDGATFIEYFPKGFHLRRRFQYLAECLNVTYQAKKAWIVREQTTNRKNKSTGKKLRVRLYPRNREEKENDTWE